MKPTVQYYENSSFGLVAFTDLRENEHSKKARSHDIKLAQSLGSRTKTAEVKNAIIQDINNETINAKLTGDNDNGKDRGSNRDPFGSLHDSQEKYSS